MLFLLGIVLGALACHAWHRAAQHADKQTREMRARVEQTRDLLRTDKEL